MEGDEIQYEAKRMPMLAIEMTAAGTSGDLDGKARDARNEWAEGEWERGQVKRWGRLIVALHVVVEPEEAADLGHSDFRRQGR